MKVTVFLPKEGLGRAAAAQAQFFQRVPPPTAPVQLHLSLLAVGERAELTGGSTEIPVFRNSLNINVLETR